MASTGEARRLGRRPGLDGVRGLAILFVLGAHASVPGMRYGGAVGVTLFFVLSGYLITGLLVREHVACGRIGMVAFYRRRCARLLPALIVVVVAYLALTLVGVALVERGWWDDSWPALLYVADFFRAAGIELGPMSHTWSLSVEEQFYSVWPAIVLFGLSRLRPVAFGRAVCALAAASLVWHAWLTFSGAPFDRIYFAPDTNAFALLIGAAAALTPRWPSGLGKLGVSGLLALAFLPTFEQEDLLAVNVITTITAFAAVLAVAGADEVYALGFLPLRWFGWISYGLYLWHQMLLQTNILADVDATARGVIVVAAAVVISWASWRFLELPTQGWINGRGRVSTPTPARTPPHQSGTPTSA